VNRGTSRGATPSLIAAVAAAAVALAIYAGSRGLRYFDAALIGYATATVFLAFGVTYRYAVWVSSPPARLTCAGLAGVLLLAQLPPPADGGPSFGPCLSRLPDLPAGAGRSRWLAHQLVFWGVVLATLITFPLTFGWLAFLSDSATGPGLHDLCARDSGP
jgi:hypothetical protein